MHLPAVFMCTYREVIVKFNKKMFSINLNAFPMEYKIMNVIINWKGRKFAGEKNIRSYGVHK